VRERERKREKMKQRRGENSVEILRMRDILNRTNERGRDKGTDRRNDKDTYIINTERKRERI